MFWMLFLLFLAACLAAGTTGAVFPPGPWYRALKKPGWTPPDWAFPVVWTTLYVFMAIAGARLALAPDNGFAMAFWALQIALNALWTPVFFGLKYIRAGMLVLTLLWLSVAGSIVVFWPVDWIAALLFLPYLLWVTIAGALNGAVWRLNPETAANPPEAPR
ncbi:tryptophan-rich sensory protein TspO [Roseivivax sp.]